MSLFFCDQFIYAEYFILCITNKCAYDKYSDQLDVLGIRFQVPSLSLVSPTSS